MQVRCWAGQRTRLPDGQLWVQVVLILLACRSMLKKVWKDEGEGFWGAACRGRGFAENRGAGAAAMGKAGLRLGEAGPGMKGPGALGYERGHTVRLYTQTNATQG